MYTYQCYICKQEFTTQIPIYNAAQKICGPKCQCSFDQQYTQTNTCLYCGKIFHVVKKDTKFCCYSCKYEYNQVHRPSLSYICDNCGKEFTTQIKKGHTYKFCTWECYQEYDNKRNKKQHGLCEHCNKDFEKQYPSQRFCSTNCQNLWQSQSRNHVNVPRKETSIEIIIRDLLNKHNIVCEYNKHFSYYEIDLFLSDFNLGIEIMGEYWHGDNRIYDNVSEMQALNIARDKRKHTYIQNQLNWQILYLWESDINDRLDLCEKLILQYIQENGKLQNYHSMNYILRENTLEVSEKLIIPYMEQKYINVKNKIHK